MYTFQPIPAIDTINNHEGFYLFAFLTILFVVLTKVYNSDEYSLFKMLVLASIPIGIVAAISWNTGTYKEFANQEVSGTLVGFTAESYNENRSSGKTTSVATVRKQYVVYEVNGNHVMFEAKLGTEYPKTAILYKN